MKETEIFIYIMDKILHHNRLSDTSTFSIHLEAVQLSTTPLPRLHINHDIIEMIFVCLDDSLIEHVTH